MTTEIYAVFSDEMLKILSSMKGKTLKAIQGVFHHGLSTTNGNIRLVLGQYAVDVECLYHDEQMIDYDGNIFVDEFAYFSCEKKSTKDEFKPFVLSAPLTFCINEVISEVILVRDEISISNGEHLFIDQAFVIKTSEKAYTFSRDDWFLVSIDLSISDKIEGFKTLKNVRDFWSDNGRYSVDVNRQFIFL